MLCSLFDNGIGDEGACALAAVLKETRISKLKCAAAPSVRFCSAPIDTPGLSCTAPTSSACSLWSNNIGAKGASALAAILKGTQIQELECAAAP